jgi:hypothetical protein
MRVDVFFLFPSNVTQPVVTPSGMTRIQLINGFANDLKHRDRYPHLWSMVETRHQKTVMVIEAAGRTRHAWNSLEFAISPSHDASCPEYLPVKAVSFAKG